MTSFDNNNGNPYGRASVWPKMPQGAFRLGGPMGAAVGRPEPQPTPEPVVEPLAEPSVEAPVALEPSAPEPSAFTIPSEPAPSFEAAPIVAPIAVRRASPPNGDLRLTPLIAAAAVGAGGMLALVLVIGVARPSSMAQGSATPPAAARTLAVGELVGQAPATAIAPPPAEAPPAVVKASTPRLPLNAQTRPAAAPRPALVSSPPMLAVPAPAQPFSTQIALPTARPIASLAGPAEPPLTAPAPAPVFTPKAAPDPNAPIPTHTPDGE